MTQVIWKIVMDNQGERHLDTQFKSAVCNCTYRKNSAKELLLASTIKNDKVYQEKRASINGETTLSLYTMVQSRVLVIKIKYANKTIRLE
jgi:hypothetical protein